MPTKTLPEYERDCQNAASPAEKRRLALEARDAFIQTSAPATITEEVLRQFNQESANSGPAAPLPDGNLQITNDADGAQLEARLTDFFPAIFALEQSGGEALLNRARIVCEQVDAYRQHNYWLPLFDYLNNATAASWQKWRFAVIAQKNARIEIGNGDFVRAGWFTILGLQNLVSFSTTPATILDYRLYLDLCGRLQNVIAEGRACLHVGAELGKWIIEESHRVKHYLRAVGVGLNLGNQHLFAGKNHDAISILEAAQATCNTQWTIRDMDYFQVNLLERLARAYINRGQSADLVAAAAYLENFGALAQRSREKTLYQMGKGYLALQAGDYPNAKASFYSALEYARGQHPNDAPNDFTNMWSAFMSLVLLGLKRNMPAQALNYLEEARKHGDKLLEFLNAGKKCYACLLAAEAHVQLNDRTAAWAALSQAQGFASGLGSPRRQIQLLFIEALLIDPPDNDTKYQQALQLARQNGFNNSDDGLVRLAIFS